MIEKLKTVLTKFRKGGEPVEIVPPLNRYVVTQEDKEKAGWISPRYSLSRSTNIDRGMLADNRCVAIFPSMQETEQYKVLRTQILQCAKERGGNTVMITSAHPGEGKSLTAVNLAFTFSKQFDQTALLVDCDLRQQSIHKLLGFESNTGLIDYLVDEKSLSDLIIWPGIDKLTLISGGRHIVESTELLGSLRMQDLVREMKTRYQDRFVLFDVPSVLSGADAIVFAPFIDFIIMVVESGRTTANDVKKSLDLLPRDKIIGFVLNRHGAPSRNKGGRVDG